MPDYFPKLSPLHTHTHTASQAISWGWHFVICYTDNSSPSPTRFNYGQSFFFFFWVCNLNRKSDRKTKQQRNVEQKKIYRNVDQQTHTHTHIYNHIYMLSTNSNGILSLVDYFFFSNTYCVYMYWLYPSWVIKKGEKHVKQRRHKWQKRNQEQQKANGGSHYHASGALLSIFKGI